MGKIEDAQTAIEAHLLDQQIDLLVSRIIVQAFLLNMMRNTGDGARIVESLRQQALQSMAALELTQMPPPNAEALRKAAALRLEQWFLDLERTAGLQPPRDKMS